MTQSEIEKAEREYDAAPEVPISLEQREAIIRRVVSGTAQSEIEKAAEDFAVDYHGTALACVNYPGTIAGYIAGAEHAKQEERFRIVQLISNLLDGSITNTTWGEIARLIEAPEAER